MHFLLGGRLWEERNVDFNHKFPTSKQNCFRFGGKAVEPNEALEADLCLPFTPEVSCTCRRDPPILFELKY
jgi:hypothetical protein